jgi:hypothetical protein
MQLKEILFGFLASWVLVNFLSIGLLIIKRPSWGGYLCHKCISFWLSAALFPLLGYSIFDTIYIAGAASFMAYTYNQIKEKWNI